MGKKHPKQSAARRSKAADNPRAKKSTTRSRILAFSIAVVFWGVVWGLLSLRDRGIDTERLNRDRAFQTRHFLREIENALTEYQKVRGAVPPCNDDKRGAEVLFENLLAGQKRYLGPRPDRIRHGKKEGSPSLMVDAWGNPIHYRTGTPPGGKVTPNPDYDLWSTGGDPANPRDQWITAE